MIHLNVRSLLPKLEELKFYLTNKKIQIFSVNETWLDSSIAHSEIAIPGFNIFREIGLRDLMGVLPSMLEVSFSLFLWLIYMMKLLNLSLSKLN